MDKAHTLRDVDLSGAARGVWLVKVPKYLSEKWQKAHNGCEVGKMRISKSRFPGGKPEVIFSTNDEILKLGTSPGGVAGSSGSQTISPHAACKSLVPKDHKFVLTGATGQHMSVLIQTPTDNESPEKLEIGGKVIQRAECRPLGDASYMNLKKAQLAASNQPEREVVQLDRVVQKYKPISVHAHEVAHEQRKKEIGKRARGDKEKVMELLFSAFEKHQYYNVKDLVRLTNQPITYLKEILNEICTYNMKAPHKNMWELKAEYRHYKAQPSESAS